MKYNRLLSFQNNKAALSRFRLVLGILHELGVDGILQSIGAEKVVAADPLVQSALQNQRDLGFQDCIDALFELDEFNVPLEQRTIRDYGATDKMVKDGLIKQEDVETFVKGLDIV